MFDPDRWTSVPFHFWTVSVFVFGCIVGSFLNVCIYRLPRGLSIIYPPSHCPHCKYSIPWYLNIPLFTWLILRGRCAHCHAPITIRYFIVELLTGLLFVLAWVCVGASSPALALLYCLVTASLIVASFIDFEHFVIPDSLTLGGVVVGFILSFFFPILHQTSSLKISMQESLLGILVGGGLLYTISRLGKMAFGRYKHKVAPGEKIALTEEALETASEQIPYAEIFYRSSDKLIIQAESVDLTLQPSSTPPAASASQDPSAPLHWDSVRVELSPLALKIADQSWDPSQVKRVETSAQEVTLPREVMGLGDVKLMAAIGAFFGWKSVIFTLFASSLLGSILGVALILLRKQELSTRIPYGPYIAVGALLWMMGGYYYVVNWVDQMLKPLL